MAPGVHESRRHLVAGQADDPSLVERSRAPRMRPRWRSCSRRRPGGGSPRERTGDGPEARRSGCRRHEGRQGRSQPASRSAFPPAGHRRSRKRARRLGNRRRWDDGGRMKQAWPAFLPGRPTRGRRARSGTTCLQGEERCDSPSEREPPTALERRCERAGRRRRAGRPPPRRPRAPGASPRAGRCPFRASAATRSASTRRRASERARQARARTGPAAGSSRSRGEEQVESDRAEPEPERPVRREERDERVLTADRRVAVGERGQRRDPEKHDREQREVAVQRRDGETRQASGSSAPCRRPRGRQTRSGDERHHARAARQVPHRPPVPAAAAEVSCRTSRRKPADVEACGRPRTSLEGSRAPRATRAPYPEHHRGRAGRVCVEHDAAATVTFVQGFVQAYPSRIENVVLLAARGRATGAPDPRAREPAGLDRNASRHLIGRSGVILGEPRRPNRPRGRLPATAMSPPSETRTPHPVAPRSPRATRSAVRALADAPRSSSTPRAGATVPEPGSSSISAPAPAGDEGRHDERAVTKREPRERPVVAGETHGLADRRIDEPAGRASGLDRGDERVPEHGADPSGGAACRVQLHELRIGTEPAASQVDRAQVAQERLRAEGKASGRRRPRVRSCRGLSARSCAEAVTGRQAASHDPPDTATGWEVGPRRRRLSWARSSRALSGGRRHGRCRLGHSGDGPGVVGVAASSCRAGAVWLTLVGVATTPATTPTPAVAAAAVPNVSRRTRRAEASRFAIA